MYTPIRLLFPLLPPNTLIKVSNNIHFVTLSNLVLGFYLNLTHHYHYHLRHLIISSSFQNSLPLAFSIPISPSSPISPVEFSGLLWWIFLIFMTSPWLSSDSSCLSTFIPYVISFSFMALSLIYTLMMSHLCLLPLP